MTRGQRRNDGGPEYPLQYVHTLAGIYQLHFTRKALDEAALLLPASTGLPAAVMRRVVLDLREENWKFAEENENGWVDVYRVLKFNRLIWAKLKVEARNAKDQVILISFHEYDDDVPI
jgi:hypothetical protein